VKKRASNPVVHLELHTGDLRSARAFYEGLCGWHSERIEAGGGSYLAFADTGVSRGIVECETSQPMWLPYVGVADIAAATDCACRLGAAVLLEPREGPAGWRSVVSTPAGAELAFWQPKSKRDHWRNP
jgi:predicted enzyme related to lactoylglutathione lyase